MLDPGTVLPKKTAKHVFQHSLPVTFLGAQMIKALPEMQETRVRSLGRKDPLEKEMATQSSTLAWKIPWTEEPCRLHAVHGVTKRRTRLSDFPSSLLPSGKLHQCFHFPRAPSGLCFKPFSALTTVWMCFSFLRIYLESSHFTISDSPLDSLVTLLYHI